MPTLQQIKNALKIEYDTDDAELLRLRDAVMAFIYNETGVNCSPKQYTQYCDYWMKTRFDEYPFIEVKSVKYYNSTGTLTTMPSTDYFLDKSKAPNSYFINFSEYPDLKDNTQIEITYTAGYADLPKDLAQCVIAFVGAWYNNPEALSPITLQEVPVSAKFILEGWKTRSVLE